MGLHNDVLLIRTLYLVSFARYSASKISVSDLDLSGSEGQIFLLFQKAHMGLHNDVLFIRTLYLVPFARYSPSYTSEDLARNTTFDLLKVIDLN